MTIGALNEFQRAVYETLTGSTSITDKVGDRIFDAIPEDDEDGNPVEMPYIVIGESDYVDDDADCIEQFIETLTLHIWSDKSGGKKETKEIMSRIRTLFRSASLDLGTAGLSYLHQTSGRIVRDPDGLSHHGRVVLEAGVEE